MQLQSELERIPGVTLKQRTLQQADWHLIYFLDQSWGLQVSLCTIVACRVPLRELITDLFPMFVNPLEQHTWEELVSHQNIIQVFKQGNIFSWLCDLPSPLQVFVLTLVRSILDQLQHTGLDRQRKILIVAWPQAGDTRRGLRIPCKADTHWTQVIADAEDCATFAYVTSRCLETSCVKCRGNLRAWQNASEILVTEMSPSGLESQPVIATNAFLTVRPIVPAPSTITVAEWELEDQKIYFIKKLDFLLRAKVEKGCLGTSDVANLMVTTSNIPQGRWKKLLLRSEERKNHRIRERQVKGDRAELVFVRTDWR